MAQLGMGAAPGSLEAMQMAHHGQVATGMPAMGHPAQMDVQHGHPM